MIRRVGEQGSAPGRPPTVVGVALVPGERVIYFHRESYRDDRQLLLIIGIGAAVAGSLGSLLTIGSTDRDGSMAFWIVAAGGLAMSLWGLLYGRGRTMAAAVTTLRVIGIRPGGAPRVIALERLSGVQRGSDLPEEVEISAALAGQPMVPTESFYWGGVGSLILVGGGFELHTQRAALLGPLLTRCLHEPGFIDRCQDVPYEP